MPAHPAAVQIRPHVEEYLLDEEFDLVEIEALEQPQAVPHLRLCDDLEWDDCEDVMEAL